MKRHIKISLIVGLLIAVIVGFKPFVKSPYYALLLGEVELYYRLKANRIARSECDKTFGDNEKLFEECFEPAKSRWVEELKK